MTHKADDDDLLWDMSVDPYVETILSHIKVYAQLRQLAAVDNDKKIADDYKQDATLRLSDIEKNLYDALARAFQKGLDANS